MPKVLNAGIIITANYFMGNMRKMYMPFCLVANRVLRSWLPHVFHFFRNAVIVDV